VTTQHVISTWLLSRVEEIEARHTSETDPRAEDVRQLVAALRWAMAGAQEVGRVAPTTAEVIFRYAAQPFAGYQGYDPSWAPPKGS
jgi:hypothetical protein